MRNFSNEISISPHLVNINFVLNNEQIFFPNSVSTYFLVEFSCEF